MKMLNNKKIMLGIELIGLVVILACLYCSIKMNIVGRTLWLDEAMLAISLNKRSLWTMFLSPLEWNQSAPVGYIIFVKIIISILGNSEFAFRTFSIIAYVALLVVFYIVCKKMLNSRCPMLCTAGLSNIAYLLEYSNMFKPYIFDAFCVIAVIFLYYLYQQQKIKFWMICVMYFLLIWCSNPVAFFAGGVVAYEVLAGVFKKNKQDIIRGIILGISICISFLIMYIVWLAPTIASTNLSEFWTGYEFPLLITNKEDLDWALYLIKFVTKGIGPLWKIVLVLALIAVVVNIIKLHNKYIFAITIGIALTLFASSLGFFPMSDRLFVFIIPILVLLALFAVYWLVNTIIKEKYVDICVVVLIACLLLTGTGFEKYNSGEAYRKGEEANESIAYIQENTTAKDMIYVFYPAIPVFQYKMGYDTTSVCGFEDNVYLGHGFFHNDEALEDIDYILGQKGIYLLFAHVNKYEPTDNLMNVLNKTGTLEKIHDKYLFYYSSDASQSRGEFSLELVSAETDKDGVCTAVIKVSNEGETHLNNGMEKFRLHSIEYDVDYKGEESVNVKNIKPGKSKLITLTFSWGKDDSKEFSLFNVGKYDMGSVGVETITINK